MTETLLLLFLLTESVDWQAATGADISATPPVIRSIDLHIGDVFDADDPRENGVFYRLANRLHRDTRPSVVRQQLLFEGGDVLDPQVLQETERLLRNNPYFSDAEIDILPVSDEQVDVVVATRDTWSLKGGISFGRQGGANHSSFEIADSNLFGRGKKVVLRQSFEVDRDSLLARYQDLNLFGSRTQMLAEVSHNSDGERYLLDLGLPFFALDSRRSLGLLALSDLRVVPIYRRGKVVDTFVQQSRHYEVFQGFSSGLVDGHSNRWSYGLTFEEEQFSSPVDPLFDTSSPLPTDRTLAYPWIDFERLGSDYLETRNMDRIGRTEDYFLGTRLHARFGVAPQAFGSDRDRLVFSTDLLHARRPTDSSLLQMSTSILGRWSNDGFENVRWQGDAQFNQRFGHRHQFFARLSLGRDYARDPESQMLLGGDSGLRGYPQRFQDGDQRFLLTLEQRFFTSWNLLRLANVGGAVFFDVGRAWTSGAEDDPGSGVLKDVGIGLRLGLNRSSTASVLHLDIAMPLDDATGDLQSVQWLASTHKSF